MLISVVIMKSVNKMRGECINFSVRLQVLDYVFCGDDHDEENNCSHQVYH